MTSTTAAGQRGFRHELLLHRSTQELLEFVLPMAREGVTGQEPTLLLVRPETAEAVRHQVGPSPYLTVQPALAEPGRPALHVRAARPMLAGYARVVHQEPVIAPSQWPEWRRLEAVMNLVLRHYDTWAVCAYDQHTLTANMVEDLQATHPLIGQDGHHRRNDRYRHPVNFLGESVAVRTTDPADLGGGSGGVSTWATIPAPDTGSTPAPSASAANAAAAGGMAAASGGGASLAAAGAGMTAVPRPSGGTPTLWSPVLTVPWLTSPTALVPMTALRARSAPAVTAMPWAVPPDSSWRTSRARGTTGRSRAWEVRGPSRRSRAPTEIGP
jgi:hypothetical protein